MEKNFYVEEKLSRQVEKYVFNLILLSKFLHGFDFLSPSPPTSGVSRDDQHPPTMPFQLFGLDGLRFLFLSQMDQLNNVEIRSSVISVHGE